MFVDKKIYIYVYNLITLCTDHEIDAAWEYLRTHDVTPLRGGAASANSFEVGQERAFDRSVDCQRDLSACVFFVG